MSEIAQYVGHSNTCTTGSVYACYSPNHLKKVLFVLFALIVGCQFCVNELRAATYEDLLAHRAVYELQLERAGEASSISGLSGRMVYEFSGSTCEGFTTKFRYVFRLESEENASQTHDQQTSLFESAQGDFLQIINKNYVDRELTHKLAATARGEAGGIIVEVTKPQASQYDLAPALFPNMAMVDMLQKAQAGIRFYQAALYDDFETGDKITQASVVIGEPRYIDGSTQMAWPVTMSYFDDEKNPDGLPDYQSHFLLDKKGVSRDILFDYGHFSMRATLSKLDIFEKTTCP